MSFDTLGLLTPLLRAVEALGHTTPGRLLDHLGRKTLYLSRMQFLVLDEADRMLDMGFIHDIHKVIKCLPARRQNMLFSATYTKEIRQLADG
ncbi:MAG: DEAD/DEAH box helicase [Desulfotignum sp.]|nr:DEAD/DEAH box helicase [Desulfobacteraceae bacterium]